MRAWCLALLFACSLAQAQDAEVPPAEPPPAAPAVEAPTVPSEPSAPPEDPSSTAGDPAPAPVRKRSRRTPLPPEAPSAAVAPPAPAPAKPENQGSAQAQVLSAARRFFSLLLTGDARALSTELSYPFQLEGHRIDSPADFIPQLLKDVRHKRLDLLTLYGIEILSPAEMEVRYGKPPARLAKVSWQGPGTFVAVANVSGKAAVALFKPAGNGYQAFAFSD